MIVDIDLIGHNKLGERNSDNQSVATALATKLIDKNTTILDIQESTCAQRTCVSTPKYCDWFVSNCD